MELEHQLRRVLTLADAPSSPHAQPAGFHTVCRSRSNTQLLLEQMRLPPWKLN